MNFFKKKEEQSESNKRVQKRFIKLKWQKWVKWIAVIVILILIANTAASRIKAKYFKNTGTQDNIKTAKVETRDIQDVLSSSGTVKPLNTYNVTTLVEGEVTEADFEAGDQVKEGDVLYKVSTEDIDNKIDSAKTAVTRAENNYDKAVKKYNKADKKYKDALAEYNEAVTKYSDLTIKSDAGGIVKTLYVEEGDTIQAGTELAQIYNNKYMLLSVPFTATEVDSSLIGKSAKVEITGKEESLKGTVTKVSNIDEALTGSRVVNMVTIEVKNPGGITVNDKATASIGSKYSSDEGTFTVLEDKIITADKAGDIAVLKIKEGSNISAGDVVLILDSEAKESKLESYSNALETAEDNKDAAKDSIETAEDSIEDAKSNLDEIIDSTSDYNITAPISGQVIRKNTLAGDTISQNSTSATPLCIIYDLSALTFEMSIDELDIKNVKAGQKVNITADALEDQKYTGVITNVSLESSTNNGVTQYPVTVRIDDIGELLPGMNVTGEIILDEVKGVLAVPNDALMRGDKVYVKDDTVKEAVGEIPVGFREVSVETGLTDGDYIEIKSGLSGKEEVYVVRTADSSVVFMPGQDGPGGMYGQDGTSIKRSQGSGAVIRQRLN